MNPSPDSRPARRAAAADREDIVRRLSRLTYDVEAFDSMLQLQRLILERDAVALGAPKPEQLSRRSKRIKDGAADIVERALGALEELEGMGRAELRPADTLVRVGPSRRHKAR